MTPFSRLISLAGLSQREAAAFLDASPSSVDKMNRGVRSTPAGILAELRDLITLQETAAAQALAMIEDQVKARGAPERIEIGYPADDHEAQGLGFPCVGAWGAMIARVIAKSPVPIDLVPRGSTVATAAAADMRERQK